MSLSEPVFIRDADGKKVQLLSAEEADRGDRVAQLYAEDLAMGLTRQRQISEQELSRRARILASSLVEEAVGVLSSKMRKLEDQLNYKIQASISQAEDAMMVARRIGFVKDFVSDTAPTSDYLRNGEWCFWVDTSGTEDAVLICRRVGDEIKKLELV